VVKLKEMETYQNYLKQQLDKEVEKYSRLLKQYEELQSSLLNLDKIKIEIKGIQRSVEKLKFDYDLVELIKQEKSAEVNKTLLCTCPFLKRVCLNGQLKAIIMNHTSGLL